MGEITAALQTLRDRWTERHGIAIADLRVGANGAVEGSVLTRRQWTEMTQALPEATPSNVVILEDRATPAPGWREIRGDGPVSLHRTTDLAKLTTEVEPSDGALRWLGNWGADLVQTDDGAIAWAAPERLMPCDAPETWPTLPLLARDERLEGNADTVDKLEDCATTHLGTPYVLGGCSRQRIDCSGLMSRIFREVCKAILPRHSMDQRRCGVRVGREDMAPGDLVFARLIDTRTAHVGLLFANTDGGLNVLHASQRAGEVVCETLDQFETGYRFMGARRVLRGPSA
jgi:cell wall-associated NlpC family hydrolase